MSASALKAATTGQVQTKPRGNDIASLLSDPKVKAQMALALPKHMTSDRLARIAVTEIRKNPKLAQCDQMSFLGAVMQCAQLGLEPGSAMGHAYLIPFENRRANRTEVQFIIGYRGMLDLARRSGQIQSIEARVVYEHDHFEVRLGLDSHIEHIPNWDVERTNLRFVYAVAKLKDGGTQFEVLSRREIETIRANSKGKDSGPWVSHFEEMAKKGLALDTPVPTPIGWTTMETLQVGDFVFDMHGKPTRVKAVSEIKNLPCFRVEFSNGDSIVCDDEHRWVARAGDKNAARMPFSTYTVNELLDAKNKGLSVTIPLQGPLDLDFANLVLDPYLFGYWIGDGAKGRASITCSSEDLPHVVESISNAGFKVGAVRKDKRSDAYQVGIKGGFFNGLKTLGVLNNKHIPAHYMRASINQRLELLSGLVDSDGCVDKDRGRVKFCSTSKEIADAVFELASSLGEIPCRTSRMAKGFGKTVLAHYVEWKPIMTCSKLQRKTQNIQPRKISAYRVVKAISRIESVPTKCIAVESKTETYLAGQSMAVTHNTAIRRLFKYLPISIEMTQAVGLDEQGESKDLTQDNPMVIDSEEFELASVPAQSQDPEPPEQGDKHE